MSRTYIPLSGDPNTYGRRGEHTFFRTEDQQPPASAPVQSSVFDSAMNTLRQIAGEAPESGGNTNNAGANNAGGRGSSQSTGMDKASNYSTLGTLAGVATGIPGLGIAGGVVGGIRDADYANDLLSNTYGLSPDVSRAQAALAGAFGSIVGRSAFDQLSDRTAAGYSTRSGNYADKSMNADKDGPDVFDFTGAPLSAVEMETLGQSVMTGGPKVDLDTAANASIPTGNERSIDAFGNEMLGTSQADNSRGSIDGYGGSAPGAFGNFSTFAEFVDYLSTGNTPWGGGATNPESGPKSDPDGGVDPNGGAGDSGPPSDNDFSGANNGEAGLGGYYAEGGHVKQKALAMQDGGFVIPADVVSGLGDGSTKAGYRRLGLGQLLDGPGTGMSDDIPASIDGEQNARVADGEVYLNPKEVAMVGGGDHTKGIKRLYALMAQVRQHRHGTEEQPQPLNLGDL